MPQIQTHHDGSFEVYETIKGYLRHIRYYGYTKQEAIQQFKRDTRNIGADVIVESRKTRS